MSDIFLYLWGAENPRPGLSRIRKVSTLLGSPEKDLRVVLIAGTNGKGSTATYTARLLSSAGYKVGLFTSPHFFIYAERISILHGDRFWLIPLPLAESFAMQILEAQREAGVTLTYFEALTLTALLFFRQEKVDIAVLEVGLGGRLDATNITKPDVCIITSIALDHTHILGRSITKIAREKGGIIKRGVPVVTSAQKSAFRVIKAIAEEKEAPVFKYGTHVKTFRNSRGLEIAFRGHTYHRELPDLFPDFLCENLSLALAGVELLGLEREKIQKSLENIALEIPGRFNILSRDPLWIFDSAHNTEAIKTLVRELKKHNVKVDITVYSRLKDRPPSMIKPLSEVSREIILTEITGTPRAENVEVIMREALKADFLSYRGFTSAKSIPWRTYYAERKSILVTGSSYLVAEAIDALIEQGLFDQLKMV